MMKREHARDGSTTELTEMVGSGPFRFVASAWKPGKTAVYVRNEAYVPRSEPASGAAGGKVARVDRVEWIYYGKPKQARRAFLAGQIDIWENPSPGDVWVLDKHDEFVVEVLDPVGYQGSIRMNHLRPPFDDPRVRLAFAHAVDQREYLEAIVGRGAEEFYDACPSFFTCSRDPVLAGSEPLATVDLDRARALLKASDYRGERIDLLNPKDFPHLAAASKVTKRTLRRIGMKVRMHNVSWRELSGRRPNQGRRKGWHLFPTAFNGLTAASPLTNIGIRTGKDAWFGWPSDPDVPALIEAYAEASDTGAQREALSRLSERLFKVLPYINFGQWSAPVAYRREVSGLLTAPIPIYWNVTKRTERGATLGSGHSRYGGHPPPPKAGSRHRPSRLRRLPARLGARRPGLRPASAHASQAPSAADRLPRERAKRRAHLTGRVTPLGSSTRPAGPPAGSGRRSADRRRHSGGRRPSSTRRPRHA